MMCPQLDKTENLKRSTLKEKLKEPGRLVTKQKAQKAESTAAALEKKPKRKLSALMRLSEGYPSDSLELELIFHVLAVNGNETVKSRDLVSSVNNYLSLVRPDTLSVSPIPHPSMLEYFESFVRGSSISIKPYFSSKFGLQRFFFDIGF